LARGEPSIAADANNALTIEGSMRPHFQTLVSITDPALYAAQALRDALRHAGIEVRGATRVNTLPRSWSERIAIIESPPLSQLSRYDAQSQSEPVRRDALQGELPGLTWARRISRDSS